MPSTTLLVTSAAALLVTLGARPVHADGTGDDPAVTTVETPAADPDAWLEALYDGVANDLAAGRPLVAHAHVPLCSSEIIRCGNARLGDGDSPRTNLYWSTSGGFRGWFGRKGSGWKQVHIAKHDDPDILEVRVWRRRVTPSQAMRRRGVKRSFDAYAVAYAWRGSAIVRAMDAYASDLFGDDERRVTLKDGTELRAGGAAHIVAYVGHNGWMDVDRYDWSRFTRSESAESERPKATIAVACITASYLAPAVSAPDRVPLLMTTSLLFAGAYSFEASVTAFARGESLRTIRTAAARAHAIGQGKSERRVRGGFTNPSDRRWKRWK